MLFVTIFWVMIVLLFIFSFIGLVFPIIPSVVLIWVGFLLYHFGINADSLSWVFWIVMVVLTVVLLGADFIVNSHFVKKFGGSKWGERVAGVAVIVGSFIFPPFGLLIVPFVAVYVTEILQKKSSKDAFYASFGSFVGFLSGTFAKSLIQVGMITWFFIDALFL